MDTIPVTFLADRVVEKLIPAGMIPSVGDIVKIEHAQYTVAAVMWDFDQPFGKATITLDLL